MSKYKTYVTFKRENKEVEEIKEEKEKKDVVPTMAGFTLTPIEDVLNDLRKKDLIEVASRLGAKSTGSKADLVSQLLNYSLIHGDKKLRTTITEVEIEDMQGFSEILNGNN